MKKFISLIFAVIVMIHPFEARTRSTVDYEKLDRYIQNAFKNHDFTGMAVSIVKDGQVVFNHAYGLKNTETKEALTTGSLFNIASCTKAFSAACIGILADQGKLSWGDKVVDYIPEFRLADPYITKELNMIDLLSHRSGLGTFYGDLLWYETDYDNGEIIRRMRFLPITNDFRSEFGYQNNMYMISGEIVKKVSGLSWSDFVYEHIFKPLEMGESKTCSQHLDQGQDIAYPHLNRKIQELYMADPDPAGTIYSSVDEMAHWVTMLLDNGRWKGVQVLSPQVIEELFTPRTLLPVSPSQKELGTHFSTYGLGWFLYDYSGKKVVEHSGGMPGFLSRVTLVPEENLGMVVLTNDLNYLRNAVKLKVLDLFLNDSDKDWSAEF
ncbi:MAG: beta-lactamase family protein, partial [Candidatus Aminicenantes bacterium]|nr:beta-lactamase family protein [Candidatus Aminicenantes bacterium]